MRSSVTLLKGVLRGVLKKIMKSALLREERGATEARGGGEPAYKQEWPQSIPQCRDPGHVDLTQSESPSPPFEETHAYELEETSA